MDIYIISPAEPSAGLYESTWTIENVYIDDDGHREAVRTAFMEAFSEITGGGHYVMFSDEINDWPAEA